MVLVYKVQLKVPVVVRLEGTNVDQGKRILKVRSNSDYIVCRIFKKSTTVSYFDHKCVQESGMSLITAEDLDDAAEKAVKALSS